MTTYTKETISTYQDTVDLVPDEFLNTLMTKAGEMEAAGKTDGLYEFLDEYRTKRVWLDQAAAEDWVNYIVPLHESYNVVLTNVTIIDNPNP